MMGTSTDGTLFTGFGVSFRRRCLSWLVDTKFLGDEAVFEVGSPYLFAFSGRFSSILNVFIVFVDTPSSPWKRSRLTRAALGELVRTARGAEVALGNFVKGVRVGRLPWLPALHPKKRKWRLSTQHDLLDFLGERSRQRNHSSVAAVTLRYSKCF